MIHFKICNFKKIMWIHKYNTFLDRYKCTYFSDMAMKSSKESGNLLFNDSGNKSDHDPINNAKIP